VRKQLPGLDDKRVIAVGGHRVHRGQRRGVCSRRARWRGGRLAGCVASGFHDASCEWAGHGEGGGRTWRGAAEAGEGVQGCGHRCGAGDLLHSEKRGGWRPA